LLNIFYNLFGGSESNIIKIQINFLPSKIKITTKEPAYLSQLLVIRILEQFFHDDNNEKKKKMKMMKMMMKMMK